MLARYLLRSMHQLRQARKLGMPNKKAPRHLTRGFFISVFFVALANATGYKKTVRR